MITTSLNSSEEEYPATDNLEAMAEALNYNAFLVDVVSKRLPRTGTCLDFGAGIGTFAQELQELGYDVCAFDPDPKHMRLMRQTGLRVVPSIEEVLAGSLAGIFTLNVLEHIEDDEAVLSFMWRVLKPSGILVIYVPAMTWLFTSMDRKVGHVRRYTKRDLARKLRVAGFTVEEARYADSLGVLATLAYRVFGSRSGNLGEGAVRRYDRVIFPLSRLLDRVFDRWLGKNLYVTATKPSGGMHAGR